MEDTDTVVSRQDGRIGRLILNRPKVLNALDLVMLRAVAARLDTWRDDPSIHAVVIQGEGARAFCAGGDIRAIRRLALDEDHAAIKIFFTEEYATNLAIARYPLPYVSLIDGICMGGGIGLSVHGTIRVATEAAMFAMPETAIAMFPDVGASFFLPRLPGHLGMFLGLTGTRLLGADAVHAGLATHFVARARLADLSADLAAHGVSVIAGYTETMPAFSLAPHLAEIDRCFAAPTIADILGRLESTDSDFTRETLATLRGMSPSSLIWSHEIIAAGAGRTLEACLAAELALTAHVTRHPDFAEGVRAMVVDKDRSPKWQFASVEAAAAAEATGASA